MLLCHVPFWFFYRRNKKTLVIFLCPVQYKKNIWNKTGTSESTRLTSFQTKNMFDPFTSRGKKQECFHLLHIRIFFLLHSENLFISVSINIPCEFLLRADSFVTRKERLKLKDWISLKEKSGISDINNIYFEHLIYFLRKNQVNKKEKAIFKTRRTHFTT